MRQFLYFVVNREALGREEAAKLGLGHAFPNGLACRGVGNGPGRQSGVICAADADGVGYWPERQEWLPAGLPGIWIGWARDQRPGPDDLRRERQVPGHLVTLSDGQPWLVPAAQRWEETGFARALPARMRLTAAGEWSSGEVLPDYCRLWTAAQRWFDFVTTASTGTPTTVLFREAADMACEALAVNYRMTRGEVAALGLLDDRQVTITAVLDAMIDMPTFTAWSESRREKKREPADEAVDPRPAG